MSRETPEKVLESIVEGINTGDFDMLMALYEPEAAFATQPGSLAHGLAGVREALTGFVAMKGKLDLKVTRVLEAGDLALVIGFGHSPEPGRAASRSSWRQKTRMCCVVRQTAPGDS